MLISFSSCVAHLTYEVFEILLLLPIIGPVDLLLNSDTSVTSAFLLTPTSVFDMSSLCVTNPSIIP